MIINHNMNAMNAHRNMSANTVSAGKSMEKLSSGLRINRAGDDAAGLAISEKMRGQIRGLDQASRNSQDGISMIQTAEGALNETHSILQRMRELAVQSTNGTLTDDDRSKIQGEANQLGAEIDKIGNQTEFNTKKLLNGNIGVVATSGNTFADGSQKTAVHVRSTTVDTTSTMSFSVATAGTQSNTTAGTFAGGFTSDSITITSAAGDAYNISLADNDDATAIVDKVNALTEESGVGAFIGAGGSVRLRSIEYGTASAFTVSGTGTSLTKAGIGAVNAGTDATINTIAGGTTSTTYSADGNKITMTDGTSKGLTFELAGTEENATITGLSVSVAGTAGDTVTINGVTKVLTAAEGADNTALSTAINTMSRETGVTSEVVGGQIKLTSVGKGDGQTITFAVAGASLAEAGASTATAGTDNITDGDDNNKGTITVSSGKVDFHVGANSDQTMTLQVGDMRGANLGTGVANTSGLANIAELTTKSAFSSATKAEDALLVLDEAISKVSSERGNLGAVQNRLEHTIANLNTSSENVSAAESRIRDVDMAKEMMTFSKNNILSQAAQAMLAQANQQPQGVLQLLR